MFNNEKPFEDYISSLPLDDQINHQHKEQLEKLLLEQFVPAAEQQKQPHYQWSSIMKNRITQISAAAILLIAIGLFWPNSNNNSVNPLQMLDSICNAENAFFKKAGITHIITEIQVFPPCRNTYVKTMFLTLTEQINRSPILAFGLTITGCLPTP